MLTIHPLTMDRIAPCALALCEADRAEVAAAGLGNLIDGLTAALPDCLWCEEWRWNDVPIVMGGVRALPGNEIGVPWMLSTGEIKYADRAAVARAAARAVSRMKQDFNVLTNMVHMRNKQAIRFIEWLGFHVDRQRCGPGLAFHTFCWRR